MKNESGAHGYGVLLAVGAVLFLMEYTNFGAQVAAALTAFTASTTTSPTTVPSTMQTLNAAGQIATAADASHTSSIQSTHTSVG
jgi:Flp pilus assembly pilin Flp